MAEVPREAVEFARIVTRALHPPEFAVAVDAVLRGNNYCAHNELSHRLKLAPKELRITMVKLVNAGLMKLEKREQTRINHLDERKQNRTVQTDFWYVPLREVVDNFIYRVHRISKDLDDIILKAVENRSYRCQRCGFIYAELEAVSRMNDIGRFVCDRYGVTNTRRPSLCGGEILEQDTSGEKRETEALKRRFESQLKSLRERAEKCLTLTIPAHPLMGADEKTWGALVPETIDAKGEAVNEDGLTPEDAALLAPAANKKKVEDAPPPEIKRRDDDTPIEKPSWFKIAGPADDDEPEWDEEEAQQNVLKSSTGTAAAYDVVDAKSYYAKYLEEFGAGEEEETNGQPKEITNEAENDGGAGKKENMDAELEETQGAQQSDPTAQADVVYVQVAGRSVKMSDVTEEMREEMTPEEFQEYFKVAQANMDDSDDDEYE